MMVKQKLKSDSGQALVEFALIIGVLLLLIFVVIESARMFQAWQTVQNAAREAGRYAITGQFDASCLTNLPPCSDPRVYAIKQQARSSTVGLAINDTAAPGDPQYFFTTVRGARSDGTLCEPDQCAGDPGERVIVNVTYRLPIIAPFVQSLIPSLRVVGQVEMYNENYNQFSNTPIDNTPPEGGGGLPPNEDPRADLAVNKTASPAFLARVGDPIVYTLRVTNNGPNDARAVTIVDTLPPGVTNSSVSAPPFIDCSTESGVITCNATTDIPWGYSFDINVNVTAPATPGVITNTVSVSGVFEDPNLGNNTDTVQHTIIDEDVALLELRSLTASPTTVTVDDPLSYTVEIYNYGNVTATDVEVVVQLPAAVTFVDASPGCTVSGDIVTCARNDLPVNTADTLLINVTAPNTDQMLQATATVTASEPNPGEGQNMHTRSLMTQVVPREADLTVTIIDNPDPVPVEETLTYTILAINNGPATATGVEVVVTLPNTVDPDQINVTQGSCSRSGFVLTCIVGNLASGTNTSIGVQVVPTVQGTIVAQATIEGSGLEADPNPNNNMTQQPTLVTGAADMAIVKTANAASVPAGSALIYTLNVTNNGPSNATGVTVVDTLPNGISFSSVTSTQGTCGHSAPTVTCSLGELAEGASATITIRVIPLNSSVGTTLVNTANVSATQFDPDNSNNSSSVSTAISRATKPYIVLTPSCGEPGATIAIDGYDWDTNGNHNVNFSWLPTGNGNVTPTFFANGANENWTTQVTIPSGIDDGIYRLRAIRQNETADDVEFTIPCPAPDLVIGNLELVSTVPLTTYEPVTFRAIITNTGNLPAVSQFFVGLYANPDPEPIAGSTTHIDIDERIAVVGINGLAIGANRVVTLTAAAGFSITGTHQLYAVVDSDPGPTGVIAERYETNNIVGPLEIEVDNEGIPPDAPPPPDEGTGSLVGTVFKEDSGGQQLPQTQVQIKAFHLESGSTSERYTDIEGIYTFPELAIGIYTITACFIEEGTEFFGTATGVEIFEDATTIQNIVLARQPCS